MKDNLLSIFHRKTEKTHIATGIRSNMKQRLILLYDKIITDDDHGLAVHFTMPVLTLEVERNHYSELTLIRNSHFYNIS